MEGRRPRGGIRLVVLRREGGPNVGWAELFGLTSLDRAITAPHFVHEGLEIGWGEELSSRSSSPQHTRH